MNGEGQIDTNSLIGALKILITLMGIVLAIVLMRSAREIITELARVSTLPLFIGLVGIMFLVVVLLGIFLGRSKKQ